MSEYENNAPVPAERYRSALRKLDMAQQAAAEALAHVEALEGALRAIVKEYEKQDLIMGEPGTDPVLMAEARALVEGGPTE